MKHLGVPQQDSSLHLDRIDPDGHYEPGNIRWLSQEHNQLNKSGVQATARLHKFRMEHPEIRYADSTLKRLIWAGMSTEQIIERYNKPSLKPKGKYGTYSIADPAIASLVRGC